MAADPDQLREDEYRLAIAAWDASDAALPALTKDAEQERAAEGVERSAVLGPGAPELVLQRHLTKLSVLAPGKQGAAPSAAQSCVAEALAAERALQAEPQPGPAVVLLLEVQGVLPDVAELPQRQTKAAPRWAGLEL